MKWNWGMSVPYTGAFPKCGYIRNRYKYFDIVRI